VGAFDPDDFAERWVMCSPFLGGELPQERNTFLAEGSSLNHATISQRIPTTGWATSWCFPPRTGLRCAGACTAADRDMTRR
jgi:hypothetical protein